MLPLYTSLNGCETFADIQMTIIAATAAADCQEKQGYHIRGCD